eukprot:gene6255-12662_t
MTNKVPDSLENEITTLHHGGRSIYLLGTAHVSKKSCDDAKLLIENVKPGVVFLELCDKRSRLLTSSIEDLKPPPFGEMVKRLKRGEINLFSFTYTIMLERAAKELEIIPGEEFRVAYETALDVGATVILGDRPVDVTLKRVWLGLTSFQKVNLVLQLVFSGVNMPSAEELKRMLETLRKKTDLITEAVHDLGKSFPWIVESLIDERDQYMVIGLREALTLYPGDIVAVIGAGHIPGIVRHWDSLWPSREAAEATLTGLLTYPGYNGNGMTSPKYVSTTLKKRAETPPTTGTAQKELSLLFNSKIFGFNHSTVFRGALALAVVGTVGSLLSIKLPRSVGHYYSVTQTLNM